MTLLKVDKSTCTQCGICSTVCSMDLIYSPEKEFPRHIEGAEQHCIRCGHCVAVCPSGSLTHDDVAVGLCTPLDRSLDISFDQAAQLIKGRRTIREFSNKKVAPEEIRRIIDIARYAPTSGNMQGVQWLVITNPAELKSFSEIGLEWMKASMKYVPPMVRLVQIQESGKDFFLHNAPVVVFTYGLNNFPLISENCVNAAAYFDLVANSAGLGCCWGGFMLMAAKSFPPMVKALGMPEGHTPFGCLMVGYPKYKYQRIPIRKPAQVTFRS